MQFRSAILILCLLSTPFAPDKAESAGDYGDESTTRGITCWPEPESITFAEDLAEGVLELTTGKADITADGDASFTGPIELRSRDRSLSAETAHFNRGKSTFTVDGTVEYQDVENRVSGSSARYVTETGEFFFTEAQFELQQTRARGAANSIEIDAEGKFSMHRVRYTSCPVGNQDWELKARDIEIDTKSGMGTARGAMLEFKGVPFVYVPYFTYPVTDERKSGLLLPQISSSDRRGFEFTQPVYWNIAPNYDATLTPRYMSKRGLQLASEFRYLTANQESILFGDYLANDDEKGIDRWRYEINNVTELPRGWRSSLDMRGVSDDLYFDDMSSSRRDTTQTYLARSWWVEYYDRVWSVRARLADFQTIDPEIQPDEEPYTLVPSIAAEGVWRNGLFGMDYGIETEAAYFTRDNSVDGLRLHATPQVSLPLDYQGLYLTPKVGLDYTGYSLNDNDPGTSSSPSRTAPVVSVNTGAIFDRMAGNNNRWLLTLEPRAQYTYIPFRDQSDFPVFDTILADFNLVQLFRENRYLGLDRLGDTSQLSIGVTTRLLESANGQEVMTATIGQTQFFDNGDVTLPGEFTTTDNSSDYIAEVGVKVWENWNMDFRYQYDNEVNKTERSSVRFQYSPAPDKAINVGYRYARESLEQTDVSVAWPLAANWRFIGRYNYSIFEGKALDRFLGLEYESCCWGVRVLARRAVSRTSGVTDSAVTFQFILKGFSNLGSSGARQLERDILGYDRY